MNIEHLDYLTQVSSYGLEIHDMQLHVNNETSEELFTRASLLMLAKSEVVE